MKWRYLKRWTTESCQTLIRILKTYISMTKKAWFLNLSGNNKNFLLFEKRKSYICTPENGIQHTTVRWVRGWNHQFAKLTYGKPYRGFESRPHRKRKIPLRRDFSFYHIQEWPVLLRPCVSLCGGASNLGFTTFFKIIKAILSFTHRNNQKKSIFAPRLTP